METISDKNYQLLCNAAENINRTQWYYDQTFLKKCLHRKTFNEQQLGMLNSITQILSELYGERFHINIIIDTSYEAQRKYYFKFDLIIHYPKLKIMNEKNEHIIVNNHFQIVPFQIYNDCVTPANSINGITVNPTTQQFLRGYAHSHISTVNFANENTAKRNICLGSNTEYKKLTYDLAHQVFDYDTFYMFAMNLTTIAQTESLSGKPYIKMSNVNLNSTLGSHYMTNTTVKYYMDDYKLEDIRETLSPLNWKLDKGKLAVVDDYKLERHCKIYGSDVEHYSNSSICRRDSLGNYYSYQQSEDDIDINYHWSFKFKDKEFPFRLAEGASLVNNKFYIHPKIKENVKKYLEHKANIYYIKKYIHSQTKGNKQEETHTLENKQGSA
jgi:hypothetical protein